MELEGTSGNMSLDACKALVVIFDKLSKERIEVKKTIEDFGKGSLDVTKIMLLATTAMDHIGTTLADRIGRSMQVALESVNTHIGDTDAKKMTEDEDWDGLKTRLINHLAAPGNTTVD